MKLIPYNNRGMMKGIYLAACKARHKDYDIIYQDIEQERYKTDLGGDMLDIDLSKYDYIIATPPCNYYSRANYRRESSIYAQKTKHLLPSILEKLGQQDKPFIVENVRAERLYKLNGIYDIVNKYNIWVYFVGRHTYFTNIMINLNCKQKYDFKKGCIYVGNDGYREGGENVHNVIEIWLKRICQNY